ncbi:MAG TPA: hypothetical protein VEU47_13460 [Candidatus Cybelea sp.]|nr:hypothetical protein [Candidatus Cybelea sp.]
MLRLGLPVIYHPRVGYGRQHQLFGFITRIVSAETASVDIITFPTNSEAVHHNNVAARSDQVKIHCWEPADEDKESLKGRLIELQAEIAALRSQVSDQLARIVMLEKRGAKAASSAVSAEQVMR